MTDQSDKPKLGTRPPLGLKRTVETGKVKQSFSHGRSNTVVVEVKVMSGGQHPIGRDGGGAAFVRKPSHADGQRADGVER